MASRATGGLLPPREFHARDTLGAASQLGLSLGAFGAVFSGIQNTLTRRSPSFLGFFSRFGGTTVYFAATGATYGFVSNFSANLRETDDSWNAAYGGFAAGALQGFRRLSFPSFFGYGGALALAMFTFDYAGSLWNGISRSPDVDEVDRKEHMRKNRRRPIEETIAELGEGRGVYAPGYDERRRQRLKEAYGIEVGGASR